MLHSFVIPAYNDSAFLEECILSLKNQSHSSEILICTSTPSDYIRHLVDKYQIKLWVNENSSSIADDWNFALSKATTKWITLAHQDDLYENNFVKMLLSKVDKNQDSLIAFTDYKEIIHSKIRSKSTNHRVKNILLFPFWIKSKIKNKFWKKFPLYFGNPICCPTVSYNRDKLKGFKFTNQTTYVLDWMAWLELAEWKGSFIFIPKKLVIHRIHEHSETSVQLKSNNRREEEKKIFIQIWGKVLGKIMAMIYNFGHKDNLL
ncbi:MAG: glycosyltransferase [Saprospiraceae bacterium]